MLTVKRTLKRPERFAHDSFTLAGSDRTNDVGEAS